MAVSTAQHGRRASRLSFLRMAERFRLELLYVLVTVPSGLLLILFDRNPSRNDFDPHWDRARQIASGVLRAIPDPSGSGNYGGYDAAGNFVAFNNTAINSPFLYFPSVLGGGHLRVSSLLTLLCCTAMVCAAIRLAQRYGTIVLAVAILPTFFLSIVYPTADAVTNAYALLWVAYVLHLYQTPRIGGRRWIVLALMGLLLGLIKVTCIALAPLLLLLPARAGWKDRTVWTGIVAAGFATLASALAWMRMTRNIPPSAVITADDYHKGMSTILHSPLRLLESVWYTLINPLDLTGDQYDTGRNIQLAVGAEFTQLPLTIMAPVLLACMLLVVARNADLPRLDVVSRGAVTLSVVAFYVLNVIGMLALFAAYSLGTYAGGMQSRYFIPILAPMALLLPNLGIRINDGRMPRMLITGLIVWSYVGLLCAHLIAFPHVA
ncbi:hypothetical protein G1C96_1943 [Bifidobacterium sp. DSM 109958]|uniref:DUF2142 domain-containing protein n=1 Tax=Bifidobacterium moraviense TaxID=2675323 RepID=A0A7Y0F584_9BIFI|nr:DUF2142 domain-containing protein [Bifidobacterium sp. DSM 109958]NMN01352.1 hypothetical protein [Bifidobacterium sp. DSM 109958]